MRILLVEDDLGIASFVVKGLKEAGYVVDHAADGPAGLERALGAWYASFGAGWSPSRFAAPLEADPAHAAALRARYVPLEQETP